MLKLSNFLSLSIIPS